MKLRPVIKPNKRNKTTLKEFDDNVMSRNCDVIVIFSFYDQFGAIRKPDSGCRVCKGYVFIKSNLLSYKNWKHNYKSSKTAAILLLWVKVLFFPKNADFLKRNADISKSSRASVLKCIFQKPHMCVYFRSKFEVSSVILTSFFI